MLGFLMVEHVCLFIQEDDTYFGVAPYTKETLSDFLKIFDERLVGGVTSSVLSCAKLS